MVGGARVLERSPMPATRVSAPPCPRLAHSCGPASCSLSALSLFSHHAAVAIHDGQARDALADQQLQG